MSITDWLLVLLIFTTALVGLQGSNMALEKRWIKRKRKIGAKLNNIKHRIKNILE